MENEKERYWKEKEKEVESKIHDMKIRMEFLDGDVE